MTNSLEGSGFSISLFAFRAFYYTSGNQEPEGHDLPREKDHALSPQPSSEPLDLGMRVFELAVRKWNLGQYLQGAVGLVAGVAVILRLTSGNWVAPLIGAPILFVFVALIRIFAPASETPLIPHQRVMQAVIGWACVLVLICGICGGLWWAVLAVFRGQRPRTQIVSPATANLPSDSPQTYESNLRGAVSLSGKGVEGALVRIADGICSDPVSVTTAADGTFSANCRQINSSDVIVISAVYEQNGRHCHAQTDSSRAYKLSDKQDLELTCEQEK